MAEWYCWDGVDLVIRLYVQPRASRDEIVGEHDGALKIRITAAPIDGKANQHLHRFLADMFGVARHAVTLLDGASGRRKTFRIDAPVRLPPIIKPA